MTTDDQSHGQESGLAKHLAKLADPEPHYASNDAPKPDAKTVLKDRRAI